MDLNSRIVDLSKIIANILQERQWHISVVESCTGGRLASALTAISGASGWFDTGLVTYTPDSKVRELGISPILLQEKGLVSKECAEAMVRGLIQRTKTDIAVATTGSCGPTPSEGHDPTYIWIAVYTRGLGVVSFLCDNEDDGRENNMKQGVIFALTKVLQCLKNSDHDR